MILEDKSKENIKAAKVLIENEYYSPSIHCAYYSNIQLMKYILIFEYDMSEESIRNEQKKSKEGFSFHYWIINKFRKLLDTNKRREFDTIQYLKKERVRADYKNENISEENSKKALSLAKEINILLTNTFLQ